MLIEVVSSIELEKKIQQLREKKKKNMESVTRQPQNIGGVANGKQARERCGYFQMPLHYPRYTQADYETMPEWKLDLLLAQYGLPFSGDHVDQKRKFAMGAFLWQH